MLQGVFFVVFFVLFCFFSSCNCLT
uniref:Uncharacterized protein n=1 Tax=Anguilla anguilla TaxID=7936 RepID=A0A0E9PG94_ANGAN